MIKQSITYYLFGRTGLTPGLGIARYKAARRAGGLCELSGHGGRLDGHHKFSVAHFPALATYSWNIIMIKPDLHKEFHAWRGGTDKWCTPLHLWYWWNITKRPGRTMLWITFLTLIAVEAYQWL